MNRRKARRALFSMAFSQDFQTTEPPQALYPLLLEDLELEDDPYLRACFFGIAEEKDELDALIHACAQGWKEDGISHATMTIMRIALYEMMYADDVPAAAAINEAVELAKKYDHENAPAFVNGILNRIAHEKGLLQ